MFVPVDIYSQYSHFWIGTRTKSSLQKHAHLCTVERIFFFRPAAAAVKSYLFTFKITQHFLEEDSKNLWWAHNDVSLHTRNINMFEFGEWLLSIPVGQT